MARKGFTLIELLVVIVIIGILVAIALPNFIRIKDKAKEAEVKQNLHSIQLSLERYAVDSLGSLYPFLIKGGDWTDQKVVWQKWVDEQGLDPATDISNPDRAAQWEAAGDEVGDTLVMEAFMPSYPGNPFVKKKSDTLLPKIHHYPGNYPGLAPFYRIVGGRESNKMWECFGPDWTSPLQTDCGDYFVHHIYFNPPYDFEGDMLKNPIDGWNNPSGNKFLTGNFSYWPRAGSEESAFGLTGLPDVAGYTLAGYGSPRTPGSDVYNRNGNYKGRFRTESCQLDCALNIYGDDIPCICNTGAPPSRLSNDGGSDTVPDGVVITLDSGLDKKSNAANADVTENNG